ncbi:hypothetical protein AMS68_002606 [Peltaster fructicola]|uniref:Pre-mRNA processing factor 4 (PRP4)-like domain-containing protein n=1 Tax=Peltaster fructicola TaxID=286661 RepID=A0A6H0XR36_9PEZI|nr:hypothetical protein AMS68_002606 [Peltaster fructicola]
MAMHPSRQARVEDEPQGGGGIDISSIPLDTGYTINTADAGPQQASDVLTGFARKRKAANIPVPTDDKKVRAELRARGEPITLFGERPEDRRDRLREVLYVEHEGDGDAAMLDVGFEEDEANDDEEFYTEGPPALLEARRDMARYSLPQSRQKVAYQQIESRIPVATHVKHRKHIKDRLSAIELLGSQIASERPVSIVRFSPNGQILATGDWSGSVKLLDVPNLDTQKVLRGHRQMVGGIAWYPTATLADSTVSEESLNLASTGGDGDIHLWSLAQDTPISTLSGHSGRVVRCAFHPSGRFLASASYDTTWRLWDVQTTTQLLLQEGHSKEVFTVAFNEEGSLLASAGLDSIGRIWDLRSGRTIMFLDAHIQPIHALDWSSDGYRVLTGSADGFAKCWDIRAVKETASIGAHKGGVSDLRWFRGEDGPLSGKMPDEALPNGDEEMRDSDVNGDQDDSPDEHFTPKKAGTFVVTAGFDKKVNIFSADDWAICKSLTGHDNTVLAVDTTSTGNFLASCGRDRTVKLWARDDMEAI